MLAKLVTHVILLRLNVYQQVVVMTCDISYPVGLELHLFCTACHGILRVMEGYLRGDFVRGHGLDQYLIRCCCVSGFQGGLFIFLN